MREPLAIRAAVVSTVAALVNLIVAFGIQLSADQIGAITTFTAVASGLVIVVWTRGAVTPVESPEDANGNNLISVDPVEYEDYIGGFDEEEEEVAPEGKEVQG